MSRIPIVSRTFHGLTITALVLDLETRQQHEVSVFLERLPESDKKFSATIQKRIEEVIPETQKFVAILQQVPTTKRYGMTEPEFIKAAHEINLLPGTEKESEE
mgnify:CR=1 FL=1